jgi:hypothetical protein
MPWPKSPLTQIAGLALCMAVMQPVVALGARSWPVHVQLVLSAVWAYALPVTLALWVAADMRQRRRTPCFDLPFLLLLAWPLSLFWYCIATRGWYGLLLAIGLTLMSLAPSILTDVSRIIWTVVSA